MVLHMYSAVLRLLFLQLDDIVESFWTYLGMMPTLSWSSEVEQFGTSSCLRGVHTKGLTGAPSLSLVSV